MLDARIRDISMQSDIFPLDRYWHQQTETSLSEAWNILDVRIYNIYSYNLHLLIFLYNFIFAV